MTHLFVKHTATTNTQLPGLEALIAAANAGEAVITDAIQSTKKEPLFIITGLPGLTESQLCQQQPAFHPQSRSPETTRARILSAAFSNLDAILSRCMKRQREEKVLIYGLDLSKAALFYITDSYSIHSHTIRPDIMATLDTKIPPQDVADRMEAEEYLGAVAALTKEVCAYESHTFNIYSAAHAHFERLAVEARVELTEDDIVDKGMEPLQPSEDDKLAESFIRIIRDILGPRAAIGGSATFSAPPPSADEGAPAPTAHGPSAGATR